MYYIGLDLGGTAIKGGIIDDDGVIIIKDSIRTDKENGADKVLNDMAEFALFLTKKAGLKVKDVAGIGIGSPGLVDGGSAKVVFAPNLKWKNVDVRTVIESKTGLPVYNSNDANCAALGEYMFGASKNYKNSIFVTLGTGVGGGIIIDGKLFEGVGGAGAEIGHTVIGIDGEQCACGRRGCYETYASATALIRQAKEALQKNHNTLLSEYNEGEIFAKDVFDCADKGDKVANEVVDKYYEYVGIGLVNLVNVFRPEIILIGGGVSARGEKLLKPLREYVAKYSYAGSNAPSVKIDVASLGNDAGIVGAASLAVAAKRNQTE